MYGYIYIYISLLLKYIQFKIFDLFDFTMICEYIFIHEYVYIIGTHWNPINSMCLHYSDHIEKYRPVSTRPWRPWGIWKLTSKTRASGKFGELVRYSFFFFLTGWLFEMDNSMLEQGRRPLSCNGNGENIWNDAELLWIYDLMIIRTLILMIICNLMNLFDDNLSWWCIVGALMQN